MITRGRFAVWFAVVLILSCGTLFSAVETGELSGSVVDASGNPIEAAQVVVTGRNMPGQRLQNTNASGRFKFLTLPVGLYTVEVFFPGYQGVRYENVAVRLGSETDLEVDLAKSETQEEEITVQATRPLVDTTSATNSVHFSKEQLEDLPTEARTVTDLSKYVPAVTGVEFDATGGSQGGQPSFRGQGQYGNNWMVDGLSVRDPRTKTLGTRLNFDAFQEVNIISDAFEPEYGQALGGIVNVVTRRGTNEWEGEVGTLLSDGSFAANRFDQQVVIDDLERRNFYGNLGGPIVKDRAHFFLSINRFDDADMAGGKPNIVEDAVDPNGNAVDPFNVLDIPSAAETADIWNAFLRLDFAINAKHHLYLSGTWDDSKFGGDIGELPVVQEVVETDQQRLRLDYKGLIGQKTAIELKAGFLEREFSNLPSSSFGPAQVVVADLIPRLRNTFNNGTDKRERDDYSVDLTHHFDFGNKGTHTIKYGAMYSEADVDDQSTFTGTQDVIFFTDPADAPNPGQANNFTAGSRYNVEFKKDADGNVMVDANGDPLVVPTRYTQYRSQRDQNSYENWSFYVQDTWKYKKASVMFGLRSDTQELFSDVGRKVVDFDLSDGAQYRFSTTFDLTGDSRNVLKFGMGRFQDILTTRVGEFTNEQGGFSFQNYTWQGPDLSWADFQNGGLPAEIKDPANWAFGAEQSAETTPSDIDPNLHPNHSTKYLLQYDHVFKDNMVFTVRGVLSQSRSLIEDIGQLVFEDGVADCDGDTIPDAPADGQPDDVDCDGEITVLDRHFFYETVNYQDKSRDFKSMEFVFSGRPVERLYLMASLVFTSDKGHAPGQFELGDFKGESGSSNNIGVYGDNPGRVAEEWLSAIGLPSDWFHGLGSPDDAFGNENWYGPLPTAVDEQLKVLVSYDFRNNWHLSGYFRWLSGYHWSPKSFQELYGDYFVFPEKRGSRETPDAQVLDVTVGKTWNFANDTKFDASVQLFNLLNDRSPLAYVAQTDSIEFNNVFTEQEARSARFFLRYSF